jgi:glycosyltransferase involved in cell wall biosynthesis
MTILGVFLVKQIRTGGDRRYLELMELLAQRGNMVIVIMNTCLDYTPTYFTKIPLTVYYKSGGIPPGSYVFKREIKKHIGMICGALSGKVDFIHIHGDMHLKSALYLKRVLRVPLFYASRNNDIERDCIIRKHGGFKGKKYILSFIIECINRHREKQIVRHADLITFQSTLDMGHFLVRTHCDTRKIVIIPGNIGLPRCAPEWQNKNVSERVTKLIYVGSEAVNKGLSVFLSVVALLKRHGFTSLRCFLLARIEHESTKELIKKLDITEQMVLIGYADPFPYLAECDLFVYPALYDAFPDTVLEALHTGCPVIASRVGGLPDMLRFPELLFESGDIAAIAARIERCVTDAAYYQHLRSLCAERAAAFNFDWAERFENAMQAYLDAGSL